MPETETVSTRTHSGERLAIEFLIRAAVERDGIDAYNRIRDHLDKVYHEYSLPKK